ncbi:hypothetical protein N7528_005745 [Penicillium herquei]|nr:hypothetical protein N7528_005745 [Penicillium herquei]
MWEEDVSSSNMDIPPASNSFNTSTQWTGTASEDDRRLHNVGVAALAAVSQYPHPVDESDSFLVSQVVNAVTASSQPRFDQSEYRGLEAEADADSSGTDRPREPSYLEADSNTLSESDLSSRSPVYEGEDNQVDMESIIHDLIGRTLSWQNTATIASSLDYNALQKDMVKDYEPGFENYSSSPSSRSDDDLEEMIKFYPDEEEYLHQRNTSLCSDSPTMHDVDLDEFYDRVTYEEPQLEDPQPSGDTTPPGGPFPDNTVDDPEIQHASIIHTTTYERNYTIDEFIHRWMVPPVVDDANSPRGRMPAQLRPITKMLDWKPLDHIYRPARSRREFFDLQQIPWKEILKVKRVDARILRDAWYTSYHNVNNSHSSHASQLPHTESYFRAKSMHTAHKASIEHFQLRNLMSVPAYNTIHFASRSKIYSWSPTVEDFRPLIDLSQPDPDVGIRGPVKISSMKSDLGLVIAGGFYGEYAVQAADGGGAGARGLVTPDYNDGITNHVDIIRNRTGRSPICVFASNDRHLRILDCETNIFLSDQELSRPINCTATSPDSRLRVVIGDSPDAWVIEADTGRPVHPLRGHRDFGFACAWSPDMRHIATSNQDRTVKIWDARTWRVLTSIDSDVAGYRSLRFSPVGGGSRTLLCCEPADRISIIDAQLYQSRQVHDFFGEIGGADYSPDGSVIWVANTDPHFGGFMQYERRQWASAYGLTDLPNEWIREKDLDADDRCVVNSRERKLRFLRNLSDREHSMFSP